MDKIKKRGLSRLTLRTLLVLTYIGSGALQFLIIACIINHWSSINVVTAAWVIGIISLITLILFWRIVRPMEILSKTMHRGRGSYDSFRASAWAPSDVIDMQMSLHGMMEILTLNHKLFNETIGTATEIATSKGEFATNVTHELHAPMNTVLGMLDLLMSMDLTLRQKEYLALAGASVKESLSLIDEVLCYAELEAGKITLNSVDCLLVEVLDEVVSSLSNQALTKHVDIGYIVAEKVPLKLNTDPVRLCQVLYNLLGNAVKFTQSGEVAIYVSVVDVPMAHKHNKHILFIVKDTGIGISPENQERIFEAFIQVDSSRTQEHSGTGLGLAVSKKIIALMGGSIRVHSDLPVGTEFHVNLPCEAVEQSQSQSKRDNTVGLRILFVSKSNVVRDFVQIQLTQLGNEVLMAACQSEAIQIIEEASASQPVDGLFVDQNVVAVNQLEGLISTIEQQEFFNHRLSVVLVNPYDLDPVLEQLSVIKLDKPLLSGSLENLLCAHLTDSPPISFTTGSKNDLHVEACRVLVVDDNQVNQQVAVVMLNKIGCTTQVAENGREAVDKVMSDRFDMVLMDCNMPVMDGYAATKQIRLYEEGKDRQLPIVAMTVNNTEQEYCFDVGMNDFLSKPVSVISLRNCVEKWAGLHLAKALSAQDAANQLQLQTGSDMSLTDAQESSSHYDPKSIDSLREVMAGSVDSLVEAFCHDMLTYIKDLYEAIDADDSDQVRQIAHAIKGCAKIFAVNDLVKYSAELERRAKTGDLKQARGYAHRIEKIYSQVSADLHLEIVSSDQDGLISPKGEKRPSILVVDDSRAFRLILVSALKREYDLEEVATGSRAVEFCRNRMPDLILMDVLMPEMDGFDACQTIRNMPQGLNIPVLMITSLDDEESIHKAFSFGASDYIAKPINFFVLRQRVKCLIAANKAERYVKELVHQDPLTGLPNRFNLMQHLRLVVDQAKLEEYSVAMLFLDLDKFKIINDSLGHDAGDLLLKAFAQRIRTHLPKQNFMARFGGDEFTILLERIKSLDQAAQVAKEIGALLTQPFIFLNRKQYVTASIGIAVFPDDSRDILDLMKYAHSALYKAKEKGNDYHFYERGMEADITRRLELARALHEAIDSDQLVLYYQPKIEFKSGKLMGAEALVRWQHPVDGILAPNVFIPVAEESGLIKKLNDWVLEQGCKQLKEWIKSKNELTLALNLSVRDLIAEEFHDQIEKIVRRYELPKGRLELEITESALVADLKIMCAELLKVKSLGVSVAIDDFGTGYSAFGYLKDLPVDVVKIDRSFIQDIEKDQNSRAIISSLTGMVKALDMKTVVEGVERKQQREILESLGCDIFQGYLVAEPLPADKFAEQFLSSN